jgi:hypothetical protein
VRFGCVVLGELAERYGISAAMRGFTDCGSVACFLWSCVPHKPCGSSSRRLGNVNTVILCHCAESSTIDQQPYSFTEKPPLRPVSYSRTSKKRTHFILFSIETIVPSAFEQSYVRRIVARSSRQHDVMLRLNCTCAAINGHILT